jgi:hypothetical protein
MLEPSQTYLITFAVRGHRLPASPLTGEREAPLRHEPAPERDHRRSLAAEHYPVVEAVIAARCRMRGGELLGIGVQPTRVDALVRLSYFVSVHGFVDAVRLVTTRRLRREGCWARGESVYTTRVRVEELGEVDWDEVAVLLRRSG